MKLLLLLSLLSFNCLAQEVVNECGQTIDEWRVQPVRCLEVRGNEVAESVFNFETGEPELTEYAMTVEELERDWELEDKI